MSKKIFVDHLPLTATEAEIRELLSEVGTVINLEWVPTPRLSRYKACTVEMASTHDAENALIFDDNGIRVRLA